MEFTAGTAAYLIVRAGLGAALAVRGWRDQVSPLAGLGHALAEACALLALVGLFKPAVAAGVGRWWIAIALYAACWEAWRIRLAYWEAVEAPSAADASAVDTLAAPLLWAWELLGAMPPILAAGYLAWSALVSAP